MKPEEFSAVLEARIADLRKRLESKNSEYARGGDKLHNFKRAGARRNTTPEDALLGMNVKHEQSIQDLVDDLKLGIVAPLEVWEEKIGDNTAYLQLLYALVLERTSQPLGGSNGAL